MVQETKEKVTMIRSHLEVAQDRQKSYMDLKSKEISFKIRDKVFLKDS